MRRGKSRKGGNLFGFFAGSGAGTRQDRRFAACGRGRRAAQEPGPEPFRAGGVISRPIGGGENPERQGPFRIFVWAREKTAPGGGGTRRGPAGMTGGRRAQPPVPVPLQIKTGRAAFLQPGAFSVSVIFSSPFFRVLFFGAAPSAPAPLPAAASKTGRCRSGGRLRPAPACR